MVAGCVLHVGRLVVFQNAENLLPPGGFTLCLIRSSGADGLNACDLDSSGVMRKERASVHKPQSDCPSRDQSWKPHLKFTIDHNGDKSQSPSGLEQPLIQSEGCCQVLLPLG